MTTFDKREEAYEARFAHDEELRFKATAHRNKALGLWAAGIMNKSAAESDAYASALVTALVGADEDSVGSRIAADLETARAARPLTEIRHKMTEFMAQSLQELKSGV